MAQDPHINPSTGNWDDNYYAKTGKYGSSGNPTADAYYNDAAGKENAYIDSLISQTNGQRDLMLKQLDAEHKLALGNDDTEQAKFLESVADGLEQKIGRIPYDYQRYTNRELQSYSLGSNDIQQNKELALKKLTNDEQALGQHQGVINENTAEGLNQRGLLTGQAPTGMNQPTTLGGVNGLAGQQAGIPNNQFTNASQGLNIQGQGINQSANQQQAGLNLTHANTMQDIGVDARRGAQNAANTYGFQNQGIGLQSNANLAALERQRQQLLEQDRINSYTKAGVNQGVLGY